MSDYQELQLSAQTKVLLAPTLAIAEGIKADASVEAEYGDTCVEGTKVTLAHHGSRKANPAPCNTPNVPVLPNGSTILVSHLDLDALGGILALKGEKPEDTAFWKAAEFIDVKGPHHMHELPQDVQDKLNAFYAFSGKNRGDRITELTDVSEAVNMYTDAIMAIVDEKHPEHDKLIQEGREWVESTTKSVESCLVQEDAFVRVFKIPAESPVFCSASYYSPNQEDIIPATVAYSGQRKAITVAFADAEASGLSAVDIMQELYGPEAGGHAGIAGSPRGREMTEADFERAVKLVTEKVKEAIPERCETDRGVSLNELEKMPTTDTKDHGGAYMDPQGNLIGILPGGYEMMTPLVAAKNPSQIGE